MGVDGEEEGEAGMQEVHGARWKALDLAANRGTAQPPASQGLVLPLLRSLGRL